MDCLLANASYLYGAALLVAFAAVSAWEHWRPLRVSGDGGRERALGNIGLLLINQALPYALVPLTAAFAAWTAGRAGFGLLNGLDWPLAAAFLVTLVVLDFSAWAVHRALHRSAWLWRVHQVHHSDLEYDATLGFRFHPLEVTLQSAAHVAVVALLGLPTAAVLLVGLLSVVHNLFVHANATLPARLEAIARKVLVTPDMHRVHHLADLAESNCNFGILLPWWDHLARSYRAPTGHAGAQFGLADMREPQRLSLTRLLGMPLARARH